MPSAVASDIQYFLNFVLGAKSVCCSFATDFRERVMKTNIQLSGLHCNNCVARVQKALEKTEGVNAAHVQLEPMHALVESASVLDFGALRSVITELGFGVESIEEVA